MAASDDMRSRLHRRARGFIEACSRGEAPPEDFDALALAIASYQAEHVAPYARLLEASGAHPRTASTLRALPAMPVDAFRLARIAAHPPSSDVAIFRTSGTSGGARGEHPLSTTDTYECAALAWGRWALFFDEPEGLTSIVVGPPPEETIDSSLHFMLDLFARRFASRSYRVRAATGHPIEPTELLDACEAVRRSGGPAIVMATSFTFVHALDALGGRTAPLPPGSRAMHTGGFKGRSREVTPTALCEAIAGAFGLATSAVVGEYGMTELSSQLYEGTLRAALGRSAASGEHGVFAAPPWLRVVAVDPETLAPLGSGEAGILRFEDLANVDGAIAIQTADLGRVTAGAVELFGRSPGAPLRGCSLTAEDLLAPL